MRKPPVNLCTETIYVDPESYGSNGVRREFSCVKNCYSVRACRYYKPFVGAGGLVCHEECGFFEHGCACKAARVAAHTRTERILRKLLAKPK